MPRCWVAVLLALLSAGEASAHGRSTSTSSWELDARGARVLVRAALPDLQRALPSVAGVPPDVLARSPERMAAVGRYLFDHIALRSDAGPCPTSGPITPAPTSDPTLLAFTAHLECPGSAPRRIEVRVFQEVVPSHLHLARVALPDGELRERVFVADASIMELGPAGGDAPSVQGSGFLDYLGLGVEHIATGFDHLLFLLALLLIGASLAEVTTLVTGFTVAHSVTLGLGVLGVVTPQSAAVEALIGLSIAVVALENFALTGGPALGRAVAALLAAGTLLAVGGSLLGAVVVPATALAGIGLFSLSYLGLVMRAGRPTRLRWFVAFVFGLVHGFGFAGVLTQIGLPRERLAAALLGFNLGVELGQLVLVAAAWPLLHALLSGRPARRRFWAQVGSTPVLAAGLYWFLTRSLSV
jgi:hypothetical protein